MICLKIETTLKIVILAGLLIGMGVSVAEPSTMKKGELYDGTYSLKAVILDEEKYPVNIALKVNDHYIHSASFDYYTYNCKAEAESISYNSDSIRILEKVTHGIDKCGASSYIFKINNHSGFDPKISRIVSFSDGNKLQADIIEKSATLSAKGIKEKHYLITVNDKAYQGYINRNNFHGYVSAYKLSGFNKDLDRAFNAIISNDSKSKINENDFELFFKAYVKYVKRIDNYMHIFDKTTNINLKKHYQRLYSQHWFGKHLKLVNFSQSKEYLNILSKVDNPVIETKADGHKMVYSITYPGKAFSFNLGSKCELKETINKRFHRYSVLGMLGFDDLKPEYEGTFDVYTCELNASSLKELDGMQAILTANELSANKSFSWEYENLTHKIRIREESHGQSDDLMNACLGKVTSKDSYCYSIKNSNLMNACLAQVKHEDSYCYSIKNSDLMNACLARVKHEDSYCYSVNEKDLMNACLGYVKNDESHCYSINNSNLMNTCLAQVKHEDNYCYSIGH